MRLGIWGIASVIFLALAPVAHAVPRYAAPKGEGAECTQAKPCSLEEAVESAKAGDEVIIGSGTYEVKAAITTPVATNIQIHGDPNGPMPRVAAAFGGPVFGVFQSGDSLAYVEIENDANGGLGVACVSSRLERVRVKTVGEEARGVQAFSDCVVRNSLFRVEGPKSTGVVGAGAATSKTSATARNVTVIASGSNSIGAKAEYTQGPGGSYTLELQNAIIQGATADLEARSGANGPGNIAVNHSNFDIATNEGEAKVIDGGGNQTAPPLYVDAENGDFREAAGSPTIDAGIAGELGPLDLAGGARVLGAAPDIGAYEFVPLPTPVGPAVPKLQSLKVAPSSFVPAKSGGAIASGKKKPKGPIGTKVTYSLSEGGPETVKFSVEQLTTGRKSGKKCVKQTKANKGKAKCTLAKELPAGFSDQGATGQNDFKFSGRLGGKALKPGRYRLVGSAGGVVKQAGFSIKG